MKSIIFSLAFVLGSTLAKVPHHHHHHQHDHGYRGYTTVLSSAPIVAKSAPVAYSKSVVPVGAVQAVPAVTYAKGGHAFYQPHAHVHAQAPVYYSAPHAHHGHAPAYYSAAPLAEHVALLSTAGKPKVYGQSIPAAAIRNVETVMVTKTITPVVTKTTTHHTHAEPALSLGHVQGYSQGAIGQPKIAPVQFNTAYTSYSNPTVGINGPVVYKGPAVSFAPAAAIATGPAAVVPEPVVKTAVGPAHAHVHGHHHHGAYAVYPGAALSLASYGIDAHAVPVSNFLELRSGKPVFATAAVQPLGAYGYGLKK